MTTGLYLGSQSGFHDDPGEVPPGLQTKSVTPPMLQVPVVLLAG